MHYLQAMNNERLTLMWNPTQSKTRQNLAPVCVKVWIESGVYLIDGTFLLPKLSWSKLYKGDKSSGNYPNERPTEPHSIDLLDICGIRATDKIDRRLHPFPDPRKSFVVETQTDIFLFESQSSEERDRIVYGLKLVIARLASLLMLRDVRAAEEFFGAMSNTVPGQAPRWSNGKDGDISQQK